MKKIRIIALILTIAMISLLFVGCGGNQEATIKIGVIGPMSGEVAVYGTSVRNAAELYVNALNKAGGIDGKEVQLVVYDDKHDAVESVNAYNKLVTSDNVVAILGAVTTTPTLAVVQAAANDKIPILTPTATHKDVTKFGKHIFRACFIDPLQSKSMAKFAKAEGAKTVAVIYNSSDAYSTGLKEAFEDECAVQGLQVVAAEGYATTDVDYKAQLANIKAKNPDMLFVPDYYNTLYLIAKQARELGYNGALLGVDGADGVLAIEGVDTSVLNNVFFSNHYAADDESPLVKNFIADYKAAYKEVPNALAALGYDGIKILLDAIAEVLKNGFELNGSDETCDAIVEAIKATNGDYVTGNIKFDANNNPLKPCTIIEIRNAKYVFAGRY